MLASILRSDRAIQMSILIVRAFFNLRELLATDKALAQRIDHLTVTVKDPALFDIVIQDIEKRDKNSRRKSASFRTLAGASPSPASTFRKIGVTVRRVEIGRLHAT